MKRTTAVLILSCLSGCAAAPPLDLSSGSFSACDVMPAPVLSRLAGEELGQTHAATMMDAVQMRECTYELARGGSIKFSVLDFAAPNPDPAMRPKDRKPAPNDCKRFRLGQQTTVACVGDTDRFGLYIGGPDAVINQARGLAIIEEAKARLNNAR